MSEILIAIVMWCKADPYPYKSVAQCREQVLQCVRGKIKYSDCFDKPEDLKEPNWNKEKAR